jgi:hypothetical protein
LATLSASFRECAANRASAGSHPTDADIKALLKAEEQHNRQKFYAFENRNPARYGPTDAFRCLTPLPTRQVLTAFASPKHERPLSLI